ncbi:MAG: polysaccharide biosynthesis C-terminal domain-containing protein [Reichenbachiella sp.]
MGIIKQQALKSTLYIYLGIVLGFANAVLLMPKLVSSENIGLISLISSYTNVFASIFTLGIPFLTVKVFPKFRSKKNKNHNGYFSFLILMTVLGIGLGSLSYVVFKDFLISGENTSASYKPFAIGFFLLLAIRLSQRNFDTFIRMLHNTTLGSLSENFVLKGGITIILLSYWYFNGFSFDLFFILYLVALGLPGLISLFYLILHRLINFNFSEFTKFSREFYPLFWSVGMFGLLGSIGYILILEIDKIMIGNMLGLSATGIYTTTFYFGLFISVPSRAIKRVSGVVISDAWQNEDIDLIKSVYYKSCLNQLIVGLYLFLGIWTNIDSIFEFLPPEYVDGKYVILFIGLANVFVMLMGAGVEIIASSKFYKYNTYFIVAMIFIVILLNYIFIPILGLTGAALATALTLVIINIGRFILLSVKLQYQPYDYRILLAIAIGLLGYFSIEYFIPSIPNLYLSILIKGSILTIIFWPMVYVLKLSSDINIMVNKTIALAVSKIKT